jgi:hypothetical protein
MPNLTAVVFDNMTDPQTPIIWACSDCEAAFSPPHIAYSTEDLHKIDAKFREHCKKAHPGSHINGLRFEAST